MGDHTYMWGDHMSWPEINHIIHVGEPYIHVEGDHTMPVPYKVRGDHKISIPYKVWGDHKSHIRHEDTSH